MNALQIIAPKPAARIARSRLLYGVSGLILLLALAGGMSMSRGEEGTASEPDAAVAIQDGRDQAGDNDKSISATPSALAPAAATTGASDSGGDEKLQPDALSATSTPAGVTNDPKVAGESGKPVAAEVKSNAASSAAIDHRNSRDRTHSRALAKLPVRQAYQSSRKSAGGAPVWAGRPPVIYGPAPEAMASYAINPADGTKTQDRMSSSPMTGIWRRVVAVPVAALDGGKQALYGVLDTIW